MIEVTEVSRPEFKAAIRGMRNSWDSHDKSDSGWTQQIIGTREDENAAVGMYKLEYVIGENDLKLMKKLVRAGSDHAKFMRQITLSFDLNAPLYFWKQFDTYKIGTTANSESTMHTINRTGFIDNDGSLNDKIFSFDWKFLQELHMEDSSKTEPIRDFIISLDWLKNKYNETKDKRYWDLLIALLPSGFNQKRTVTLNYAVLSSIYHSRKSHKLSEWKDFCDWIETLPYSELITGKVVNE